MNTEQMSIRGQGHTQLRAELDRQGKLHDHEHQTLVDAADALLFDEQDARQRLDEAMTLIDHLCQTGRRSDNEGGRLRAALERCAAVVEPVA